MPDAGAALPRAARHHHARRGRGLDLAGSSAILGFQQFGLPTVLFGLALAYSGAALYAWRVIEDRRRAGPAGIRPTLHVKLTGAMLLVLVLDGIAYLAGRQHRVRTSTARWCRCWRTSSSPSRC